MNVIKINRRRYSVPGSWDEITEKQVLSIAPYVLGGEKDILGRRIAVLFKLLPAARRYWQHSPWVEWLLSRYPRLQPFYPLFSDSVRFELLNMFGWVFNEVSGKSIISEFWHERTRYFLPEDNLQQESIIAFAFASHYLDKFAETGNIDFVDLLIGCIAREERAGYSYKHAAEYEGDKREPFLPQKARSRAECFKTLSPALKYSILLYFIGSKRYIQEHYSILFEKQEEPGPAVGDDPHRGIKSFGKKKIPRPNMGWLAVIFNLAELGALGTFNEVKHQFLHTCCYFMAKRLYDVEEIKK